MSRSVKHTAIYKQRNNRHYKRLANKRVRRVSIQSGAAFKRVSESYDICDYSYPLFNVRPDFRQYYDFQKAVRK